MSLSQPFPTVAARPRRSDNAKSRGAHGGPRNGFECTAIDLKRVQNLGAQHKTCRPSECPSRPQNTLCLESTLPSADRCWTQMLRRSLQHGNGRSDRLDSRSMVKGSINVNKSPSPTRTHTHTQIAPNAKEKMMTESCDKRSLSLCIA